MPKIINHCNPAFTEEIRYEVEMKNINHFLDNYKDQYDSLGRDLFKHINFDKFEIETYVDYNKGFWGHLYRIGSKVFVKVNENTVLPFVYVSVNIPLTDDGKIINHKASLTLEFTGRCNINLNEKLFNHINTTGRANYYKRYIETDHDAVYYLNLVEKLTNDIITANENRGY